MGLQLGKYIKNTRKEKKIAVMTMSKLTGISKSYLDYIESGAREPQVEMLAKIAVVLEVPLETLIDIQKREQLEAAITKLRVEGTVESEEELRAVARTANTANSIDAKALAKTQEAFRQSTGDKRLTDFIENPDLKAIFKVGTDLSDAELDKLRKVVESLYPDAFNDEQ